MEEKVVHITDNQYIKSDLLPHKLLFMHNLSANFQLFLKITKSVFKSAIDSHDNFRPYPRKPKMSDCQIIALAISAEAIGVDSENYLFGKLAKDYPAEFPGLIHRTRFNRRRKTLAPYIRRLNQCLADELNEGEDCFLVDSIPIPICKIAREKTAKICKEQFETAPDKGYSAVTKAYYYGYKLHVVTSVRGVYQGMDLSKASVHDVHYLRDIKQSGLTHCTLIGDKGYLSQAHQTDLFHQTHIRLETPKRMNQQNKEPFHPIFKRVRKRIETLFAQLCDQFMLKRNYAKSVLGLSTRILTKITAVTCLQHLNASGGRPINHLKHALANV